MSEWTAWGALRPTETFPPAISSPLRLRHWRDPARVRRSEPLSPSWEKRHPNLHGPASPSRAAWVGFGHLGKTAHFTGTETLPLAIPHKGTKLGALARRQGLGCGVVVPNTHTRTGSKTLGMRGTAPDQKGAKVYTF